MQTRIALFALFLSTDKILCRVLPENEGEVKVMIPAELFPKKEALFWQRQLVILFVPTNNLGLNGLNGLPVGVGGLPGGVGGIPVGGLPGGGFNARNRNLERLRTLRRRNRVRVRTTTPSYETLDNDSN